MAISYVLVDLDSSEENKKLAAHQGKKSEAGKADSEKLPRAIQEKRSVLEQREGKLKHDRDFVEDMKSEMNSAQLAFNKSEKHGEPSGERMNKLFNWLITISNIKPKLSY